MISINRQGSTRDVILTVNYCIKIPSLASDWRHFLYGMLANDKEKRMTKEPIDNLNINQVIIGLPLGLCNVYKRAKPLSHEEFLERLEEIKKASLDLSWGEGFHCNYGLIDNEVVILDYAK